MKEKYLAPDHSLSSFTCPHCGAHSQMDVSVITVQDGDAYSSEYPESTSYLYIAVCCSYQKKIIWVEEQYIPRNAVSSTL